MTGREHVCPNCGHRCRTDLGQHLDAMVVLRKQGRTYAEIGAEFGCTSERVRQLLAKIGMTARLMSRTQVRRLFNAVGVAARMELRKQNGGSTSLHGSRGRYNVGCRCDECRRAMRDYNRSLRSRTPPNHGTESAYRNFGCRCDACKRAGSKGNRRYRIRRAEREAMVE